MVPESAGSSTPSERGPATELGQVLALARAALHNLEVHRQRIDDLNVYPVPDGDTGTNLVHTLRGIVEGLEASPEQGRAALASLVARTALGASKGNSGVIFSQIVRGAAEVLGRADALDAAVLAAALRRASGTAYEAVSRVGAVEGTILTVMREMAEEGEKAEHRALSPESFLRIVLARGEDALARTPEQLEILRRAGVVDAGGAGLVEIVRGITLEANGEELPALPESAPKLGFDAIHQELSEFRYCTGFVLVGDDLDADALEDELARLGDSLLVVGDRSMLKVHVHTDDPGAALALGTSVGVLDGVEIANMHAQTEARERRLLGMAPLVLPELETGLVAVSPGRGISALFEAEHATVVDGGQTSNPSVDDIVRAIEGTAAAEVIVLPNNSNVLLAAEQAAKLVHTKRVRVVPSRSPQAGWALLTSYVATSPAEGIEADMRSALEEMATGEVTIASRDAELDGVSIREGAFLGRVDGSAVAAGDELEIVALDVVERMLASGARSWLGILVGEGAPPLDGLVSELRERHPGLSLDVRDGDQPHYPLLVVAE